MMDSTKRRAENETQAKAALGSLIEEMQQPVFKSELHNMTQASSSLLSGSTGDSLAHTLEMMQRLVADAELNNKSSNSAAGALESVSDDVLGTMMAEFEAMGRKQDFGAAVDGVMRQLLDKQILYVPMKHICELFPAWLAQNALSLSPQQYQHHGRQYQVFQKLVATYETDPDNFPRLMELMQDLQAYGTPPRDLLRQLAPGLELTADGLPLLLSLPGQGMGGIGNPATNAGIPEAAPLGGCSVM